MRHSFLSILVSMLIFLASTPVSLLAERIEPDGSDYSVDESFSFSASAAVTSSWNAHANINVTFTNCGDETIHNWFFIFDLPYEIENIWNASVVSHQEGVYLVKNAGWNQDIPVGGSVTIGFTAASTDGTDITVMPTFFLLNTKKIEVDTDSVSLSYQEYSVWGSGFTGALTLSHCLEHALTDWSVSFSCNRPIFQANNGILSQSEDGTCLIYNDGNQQNVEVGATRLIGIQGGAADAQIPFALSDVRVFMWTQAFSLTEDANGNGVADYLDFITGNEPGPEIDYETDSDGDGIPDYFEIEWGTDPFNIDTDGDGIDDMTEIYCGMDPLTSDLNEDFDGDGLTLQQEQALGTEFWNADTDFDGLSDGDEVHIYGTDPLQEDTDGDGLLDGDEIDLGLDPLKPNTHGVPDNEYTQTHVFLSDSDVFSDINTEESPYLMSLEITASGNVPKYLSVSESSYSAAVYNETMLGTVAELDYEGGHVIEEVKLTFNVRDEYIPNPDSPYAAVNPEFDGIRRYCVFRFFEDIAMLLPVETQYDEENQTAYVVTDLFGTYCLMDMDLWLEQIGILPSDIATENTSGVTQVHFQTGAAPQHNMFSLSQDHDEWMMDRSHVQLSANQVRCERYNGHRYAVIDKKDMPWPDAKAYCEYMGGHLVTITDEAEQAFVNAMLLYGDMNLYWIGAYRDGTEFRWITGEAFEYANWDGGEPSNESENVVHMYRNSWLNSALGTWNDTNEYVGGTDFHSTIHVGLVCEWETPVNVLYGMSLRPCYRASELTNLADADWDNDGIPNWQEIRIDPNLGYWNIAGKYIPATLQDYMRMYSGIGNPFARFNLNPAIIPVIPVVSHPEKKDSDGDGLLDGAAQYVGAKKVAPKDPDPLKANGPIGVWQAQIEVEKGGNIPSNLANNIESDFSEWEIGMWPKATVGLGGECLLNMRYDTSKMALHAQVETWQKRWGYNDLYDKTFYLGTFGNIRKEKFRFSSSGEEYVIWVWRGWYYQLESGAEIGIYTHPHKVLSVEQWDAIDFEIPMTINLYNDYGRDNMQKVFCWAPKEEQWWITGFNPGFTSPKAGKMVVLGTLDFSGRDGMFEGLRDKVREDPELRDFMIFDEDGHTVWLIWWEK